MITGMAAEMLIESHILLGKVILFLLKKGFQTMGEIFDVIIGMLENY